MTRKKLSLLDVTFIGLWAAMTFAVKLILAPVANVELVSLLLCTFTAVMGLRRGVLCALVFTTLTVFESSYYGAGDWIALYYIDWPVLTVLTRIFLGKKQNAFRAATLLGLFGLLFDVPSAGIKLLLFGPVYAVTYLVSGITFDLLHGAANFVSAVFLYQPCFTALNKVRKNLLEHGR